MLTGRCGRVHAHGRHAIPILRRADHGDGDQRVHRSRAERGAERKTKAVRARRPRAGDGHHQRERRSRHAGAPEHEHRDQRHHEARTEIEAVVPVRPVAENDEARGDEQIPVQRAQRTGQPERHRGGKERREGRLEEVDGESSEVEAHELEPACGGVQRTPGRLVEPEAMARAPEQVVPEERRVPGGARVHPEERRHRERHADSREQQACEGPASGARTPREPCGRRQCEGRGVDGPDRGRDAEPEPGEQAPDGVGVATGGGVREGHGGDEQPGERGRVVHVRPEHERRERSQREERDRTAVPSRRGVGLESPEQQPEEQDGEGPRDRSDHPLRADERTQREHRRPSGGELAVDDVAEVDEVEDGEELAQRRGRHGDHPRGIPARLEYLHDLVDQKRPSREHDARDRQVDGERRERCAGEEAVPGEASSVRGSVCGSGRRRRRADLPRRMAGIVRGIRLAILPAILPAIPRADEGEVCDERPHSHAERESVRPVEQPGRILRVALAARDEVRDREEREAEDDQRDQPRRHRSTSSTRFWRSAGLTPGMLDACARVAGRRASSFWRASTLTVCIAG